MSSQLVIECGAAATRAALLEEERVVRFWFGPARGDEANDLSARSGRCFAGRVKSVNHALDAAFVDVGDEFDSFLALTKKNKEFITEGALIPVRVKSPPRQGKGAVLKYLPGETLKTKQPGRIEPIEDAILEAFHAIGDTADQILIDDGAAVAALKAAGIKKEIKHEVHTAALFEAFGIESELETAFENKVELTEGGRLFIEETQALAAIDVDTAGLEASSPERLREKIATAAAYEAMRQIRLRNIGGHIVIDFPSLRSDGARRRFSDELRKATAHLSGATAFSFSKSGLYSFTVPHSAQSFSERFTEPTSAAPSPGRQFTLDWLAKSAVRMLEHRLRSEPRARFRLLLGSALASYINGRSVWLDRLRDRYGARFDCVEDKGLKERWFELSGQ